MGVLDFFFISFNFDSVRSTSFNSTLRTHYTLLALTFHMFASFCCCCFLSLVFAHLYSMRTNKLRFRIIWFGQLNVYLCMIFIRFRFYTAFSLSFKALRTQHTHTYHLVIIWRQYFAIQPAYTFGWHENALNKNQNEHIRFHYVQLETVK